MAKPHSAFSGNPLLFGRNPTENVVALEQKDGRTIELFLREADTVKTREVPFEPFLWTIAGALGGFDGKCELEELKGGDGYNLLARFPDWETYQKARKFLSTSKTPLLSPNDPLHQFMLQSGLTSFKGMAFGDLRRLQLDIETASAGADEFSNADNEGDRIIAIALGDSTGWEELLTDADEKSLLEKMVATLLARDPDVIEGHNLFRFDLPYILKRAKRHKVRLPLGRDGSVLSSKASRVQIAEKTINYPKFELYGRHIVDTYLLVQFYDVATRELESFGLKEVARHFGLAAPARTYIPGHLIARTAETDPETFKAYALDDVRETRAIAGLLSQSSFIQAQIFPFHYQNIIVRGNATKIDALFLREYLHHRQAIPWEPEPQGFMGGYTDVFFEGVAQNVWHCDVASLYPSVMLAFDYVPEKDTLGIFKKMLTDLRTFRLDAKRLQQNAAAPAEKNHYHALQQTFKILINSFYGYLGFAQGHFADYNAAADVTAKGREIITSMMDWLKSQGCQLIELDTDGIYFVPPVTGGESLEKGLAAILPPGITVEFDERFRAMFSYKSKNYALLREDGSVIIKGAALKSRGLEKFQRDFMQGMIRMLLEGRNQEVPALLEEYRGRIERQEWDISLFLKKETLQDSLSVYQEKIAKSSRNRSAAYELALRSGRDVQPGDSISYYITGDTKKVTVYEAAKPASEWNPQRRDENIEYYGAKLSELYKKFADFIRK
ncbi:MAG: DNA polymerase domain-containing protein [Verrucomicrobiae bacterium]|nr:DNA polymerase domain-containing protein [Verrucomicrobiae bacterium]